MKIAIVCQIPAGLWVLWCSRELAGDWELPISVRTSWLWWDWQVFIAKVVLVVACWNVLVLLLFPQRTKWKWVLVATIGWFTICAISGALMWYEPIGLKAFEDANERQASQNHYIMTHSQ